MSVPNWLPLPTPTGKVVADQCRSLGLVVGDVIRGRGGVDEATLTLLWLGNEVAVWHVSRTLNSDATPAHDDRLGERESAMWTLGGRKWDKLVNANEVDQVVTKRPVIGITPRFIWVEQRRDDIYEAIIRRRQALLTPPLEWLEELIILEKEILERIEKAKQ